VAAERAIAAFGERADGQAGVVVVDADGETGAACDSPAMATAAWP
jgi:isoaspartyl peptidase/L-asparaginase-like protein (Ntn-hydrolase superfamily)